MVETKLPRKPSVLIRLALDDLRKVETDERYTIDMDVWHAPKDDYSKCTVCLVGSVMAKSLEIDSGSPCFPSRDFFSQADCTALKALEWFRLGHVFAAFSFLDVPWDEQLQRKVSITPYALDRDKFQRDMEHLATLLDQKGY